jgi:hypothetical protein
MVRLRALLRQILTVSDDIDSLCALHDTVGGAVLRLIQRSRTRIRLCRFPRGSSGLLLVDDGSLDRSTAMALDYARLFPNQVRYLEHVGHVNRGMSAS